MPKKKKAGAKQDDPVTQAAGSDDTLACAPEKSISTSVSSASSEVDDAGSKVGDNSTPDAIEPKGAVEEASPERIHREKNLSTAGTHASEQQPAEAAGGEAEQQQVPDCAAKAEDTRQMAEPSMGFSSETKNGAANQASHLALAARARGRLILDAALDGEQPAGRKDQQDKSPEKGAKSPEKVAAPKLDLSKVSEAQEHQDGQGRDEGNDKEATRSGQTHTDSGAPTAAENKSRSKDRLNKWVSRLQSPRGLPDATAGKVSSPSATPDGEPVNGCAKDSPKAGAEVLKEVPRVGRADGGLSVSVKSHAETELERLSTCSKLAMHNIAAHDAGASPRTKLRAATHLQQERADVHIDAERLMRPVHSKLQRDPLSEFSPQHRPHTEPAASAQEALEYVVVDEEGFDYVGWVGTEARGGGPKGGRRWERSGSVRWKQEHDLHEYHGEFRGGRAHGRGTHFLPDGGRVTCQFVNGCPSGEGVLRDADGRFFDVVYSGEASLLEGAKPVRRTESRAPAQLLHYCKYGAACPAIALSIGAGTPLGDTDAKDPRAGAAGPASSETEGEGGGEAKLLGHFPNVPRERVLASELAWARPVHAQVPLWNTHAKS
jgi:hypothetical protein